MQSASALIADVRNLLQGEPVFLAGSLVAEQAYGKTNAHSDVDLFCPTFQAAVSTTQKLLDQNYKFDDRFDRVWYRWLRYGVKQWHTNSMRVRSPSGVETNIVYKITDGHPTTSLAQVLESFDFGLLGMGYDLESGLYLDMRGYLFPQHDINGALPMMPSKRNNWRQGFISQYNGLREVGRYAKYHQYGYDLSLVKEDLVEGYWAAASYMSTTFDDDKKKLGLIYEAIAKHIEFDNIDELVKASKEIDYNDELDVIMEALE